MPFAMEEAEKHCCLSHEFYRAATKNPNKIAVIHASSSPVGEAQIDSVSIASGNPPVYPGDCRFTFNDVMASVGCLTSRLRSILNGANDPSLVNPQSLGSNSTSGRDVSLSSSPPRGALRTDLGNVYCPKIVGIYIPPSVEYIISVLSVLRCGEAFLPLDPSWPRDRILSIVSSSNAALVIACGSSFGKRGCEPIDKSHWLLECCTCPVLRFSMEETVEQHERPVGFLFPCEEERQRLFCYLLYTSGSTGMPKGVCGTEQGLLNRFLWMQELYPLHGVELLLFKTSISFIDHLQEFLTGILTACTLVIPPFTKIKANMFSVIDFLKAYSISRFTAVPSLMRAILPALQNQQDIWIQSALKLLVLSGEVLPLSLWKTLSTLLPKTSILNLYGSTEVSGDCTYFDCKMLPSVLETETLTSVPVGLPIAKCDVVLGESDTPNEGEICVGGLCVSIGYFSENKIMPMDYTKLHQSTICNCSVADCGGQLYFRTGDFARRLPSGDLVFLGRKDRTIKINGQRVALEEIENTLRRHCNVANAAVICHKDHGGVTLIAFIMFKEKKSNELMKTSIRSWMTSKLPLAMIPNHFIFVENLPMSASGKVDYRSLEGSILTTQVQDEISDSGTDDFMQVIKKAFCVGLMVGDVSDDDDFFVMGGNSIAAAHVSHTLGIDMRLLYACPTPYKLLIALTEKKRAKNADARNDSKFKFNPKSDNGKAFYSVDPATPHILGLELQGSISRTPHTNIKGQAGLSKRLKVDSNKFVAMECDCSNDGSPWNSATMPISCSFSHCNKIMHERCEFSDIHQLAHLIEVPRNRKGSLKELWKVHMESCVDASPVVVFKDSDAYLFIGSHSHKFLCVNAKSGSVQWEIRLQGRIEGSAAVVGDFSQVVVGCYGGKIYFLDFSNGNICWTFQTSGEVKCQPLVDVRRQLIWCGSHDHNLYALDYRKHCCVYKLPCGGSIFGSPSIDEVHDTLYVASTSGCITAISIKDLPFHTSWLHELEVPIFGSLCISPINGYVICCLVDGHVLAFDLSGLIIWRYRTGGPIFAGACTPYVLHSQVLICSRNGSVYSFELEKGELLWELNVGDPITSSAYVDENLGLLSNPSVSYDRLVCICTSSGIILLLRINLDEPKTSQPSKMVEEFARLELQGDVFSSPVMIGGRIFVGCRDDYLHCIAVETQLKDEVWECDS
ncbi:hypothetical protein SLEP1_g19246 [Rubroshorea leprosula]|nr:hypothetical protein SLEP1_g19246 [Rubroshorea leprosula]